MPAIVGNDLYRRNAMKWPVWNTKQLSEELSNENSIIFNRNGEEISYCVNGQWEEEAAYHASHIPHVYEKTHTTFRNNNGEIWRGGETLRKPALWLMAATSATCIRCSSMSVPCLYIHPRLACWLAGRTNTDRREGCGGEALNRHVIERLNSDLCGYLRPVGGQRNSPCRLEIMKYVRWKKALKSASQRNTASACGASSLWRKRSGGGESLISIISYLRSSASASSFFLLWLKATAALFSKGARHSSKTLASLRRNIQLE